MAKGLRKQVKRKLASAHNNLEDACYHLDWLIHIHKDSQPELAEALECIMQNSVQALVMVEQFWETTQGELPEDWRAQARA